MKRLSNAGCTLAAVVIVLLTAASVFAYQSSKIETRRGEVYTGCDFRVDRQYKVIEVMCPDKKRNVGFNDVAHIYDEAGVDVTAKYLGKYYRPDEPSQAPPAPAAPAPVDTGEVAAPIVPDSTDSATTVPPDGIETPASSGVPVTPVSPQASPTPTPTWQGFITEGERTERRRIRPYQATFNFSPCFSIPIGSYYDGLVAGVGFGGALTFSLSPELALQFSVTKQGVKVDSMEFVAIGREIGLDIISHDVSVSMMRYAVSLQYYAWPRWEADGRMMYYISAGLGAINHAFSGDMYAIDPMSGDPVYGVMRGGETKFMTTMSGGIVPMLTRSLGIECSLNWDLVYIGSDGSGESYYGSTMRYASVIEAHAGLVMFIR